MFWMLAAAALCTAVGSGGRSALARMPQDRDSWAGKASVGESVTGVTSPADESGDPSPTPEGAGHPAAGQMPQPADFCLAVKNFDFNERPLGNYEDTPMYWRRMTGEGLPAYSDGQFDEQVGHLAAPSFLFTLRGGSIGYEYDRPDLAVSPNADYLIEGYVRAAGLEDAVALVACYLVDQSGQRIAGSEQVSRPINSALGPDGGTTEEWQRIEIPVRVDAADAAGVRLQLWVVQNYVVQEPHENAVDPIMRQEVDARVWFDDLALVRLPRARLSFATPGGLIQPGAKERSSSRCTILRRLAYAPRLTIVDDLGEERSRTAFELPPGADRGVRRRPAHAAPGHI